MNNRIWVGLVVIVVLGLAVLGGHEARTAAPPPVKPPKYPDAEAHRPTPVPDRLILTWKTDPATSQAVTWRTDVSVSKAYGEIAVAEDGPQFAGYSKKQKSKARQVVARTSALQTDLGRSHYHEVHFEKLQPDTLYVYRVGDGSNWSEWFHFRTASESRKPFSFLYFGDAQNDVKSHWSRVIRQAVLTAPEARFFIHAGDLINRANRDAEWGEWFHAGGWVNGSIPSVPTPGNHEWYDLNPPKNKKEKRDPALYRGAIDRHWRYQFSLPENGPEGQTELAYHFDYQGVRFVSLNSNRSRLGTTEDWEKQARWLEEILKDNPCKWTVLTFHHPIYSPAKNRDNAKMREIWQPVFDRCGVDLVLQGHDHTYARSGLMTAENAPAGTQIRQKGGVVYCVSVSGPKMYNLNKRDWMVTSAEGKQLYQVIRVDGDRLRYQAHFATGKLFDLFELEKKADGTKVLHERAELEGAAQGSDSLVDRTLWMLAATCLVLVATFAVVRWLLQQGRLDWSAAASHAGNV